MGTGREFYFVTKFDRQEKRMRDKSQIFTNHGYRLVDSQL